MFLNYAELKSHRDIPLYEELTSLDVAEAAKAGAHVIIVAGATEQHAGHLPLGTDTYQGLETARRAAYQLAKEGVPVLIGQGKIGGGIPSLEGHVDGLLRSLVPGCRDPTGGVGQEPPRIGPTIRQ